MEEIEKLQYISLSTKISNELNLFLGVKDKVLTEFLIEEAIKAGTEDDFIEQMNNMEAGFTLQLCLSIFNSVHKMLPEAYVRKKRQEEGLLKPEVPESKGGKETKDKKGHFTEEHISSELPKDLLTKRFPGLALPNNNEEIELNLDDDLEPEMKEEKIIDDGLANNKLKRKESITSASKASSRSPPRDAKNASKNKKSRHATRNSSEESVLSKSRSRSFSKKKKKRGHSSRHSSSSSRDRKDRKHRKNKEKDRKHHKRRESSKSEDRKKKKKRDRSHSSTKDKHKQKEDNNEGSKNEPVLGKVYDGFITMKLKHGILVQMADWRVSLSS
jgi:ATP-dependent RNA helicase DHX8/PRP22